MEIIKLIKAAMSARGKTQEETGKLLSMEKSNYNRLIMKNNNLRVCEVEKIAHALNYDISITFIDKDTGRKIEL